MSDYAIVHNGRAYTPNQSQVALEDVDARNAAIEAAELKAWSEKPDAFVVYVGVKDKTVTTWRGIPLGTIVAHTRFRTNISRNIVAITVRGNNGATYHGRYGADWSQAVRLRKSRA